MFLQDGQRVWDGNLNDFSVIADFVNWLHMVLRFEMQEPKRCVTALQHWEATLACSKAMWTHYLAETDDDREWIPNPKQQGVLRIPVKQEMIDTWLLTMSDAEEVLKGKQLVSFWRGRDREVGVNFRRVITEPRRFDLVQWIQGTAAPPYLERGPATRFAEPELWRRINDGFGQNSFIGFVFWFN